MDIQKYIEASVKANRADSFAKSDQLTLGEIISKCQAIEANLGAEDKRIVSFDFANMVPTNIDSWRGSYAELALSFNSDEEGETIKVGAFINMLESAVGKTFTGYKGGDFTMSRHTPVWVANYGKSGSTAIIDVIDDGYWAAVLMTGYREF